MSGFSLGFGLAASRPLALAPVLAWILARGVWNDDGVWDDAAIWKDAP
jgi:hypothetical protein